MCANHAEFIFFKYEQNFVKNIFHFAENLNQSISLCSCEYHDCLGIML